MNQRRTINVRRVVKVLQGAARSGVSIPELLDQCGIERRVLEQPDARIERDTFIRLMLLVMEQTQDEFLGFGQGRKSKPGTFSMMAHAVINCPTLDAAVRRGIRFYELFDLNMRTWLRREGDQARLITEVDPRLDFRDVIIDAMLFLSLRFMSWLVGKVVEPQAVYLDYQPLKEDDEHRFMFNCPTYYNSGVNQVVFPVHYLDLPLVRNELSLSHFLRESLAQLFEGNVHNVGLPARIRGLLSEDYGGHFPDFGEVCRRLQMTPQTLRRRLKDDNTSYQEIKDSIRKDASVYYLSKAELSIDEIALLMGFSEASSFHRAFKKWTNMTPSAYRRTHFGETNEHP
ncbi:MULTISPECIES: AraC family transcriptional regulator [Alcanivoracaceae]|uniref:AraC family transcriptional regulator n=2 Tax=Alcanivoracaceae TaxID=224372 RepID=A0A9Q3W405_9GAMM|nr:MULTISPECIES: AraC family transcriptional regulator [Alcanivoracaceae]KYZ86454.1 AraC family transcriptional regulator [Alcanivorax sp. KX64203]MBA4720667.1 AraC family transcriptional regulator [Alcanivorax sp.]ARB46267.1 AraC family transcriptional regulator [Alloalcanivorax xenomutans]KAF0806917.1 AraC family transcriptional regulator [Alcanivorax xiamenensis]MCE7507937.1 AraC family transcriptional regulator [Alloalcanivorax xenomutans]|tara:strand:+ start:360 stop:1388 length:1029 start_codon:yes stop_codon:yes gene_type:complete